MTDTTDNNSDEAIAARLAALRAKRPDWYDTAPFRFENGLGEDWGARIRSEGDNIFVDITGCDVEYEVRSAHVIPERETMKAIQLLGWVLGRDEASFVAAILIVAKERARTAAVLRGGKKQ